MRTFFVKEVSTRNSVVRTQAVTTSAFRAGAIRAATNRSMELTDKLMSEGRLPTFSRKA